MEPLEIAVAILLIIVIGGAVAYMWKSSEVSEGLQAGGAAAAAQPTMRDLAAAERAWQINHLDKRTGVRNDSAGYGSQRTPHPLAVGAESARGGRYLAPAKVLAAEQQAWAPYNPESSGGYDVKAGKNPGTDLTQNLGNNQVGDWSDQLSTLAVDPRTQENHRKWANEVGPFSQGAMTVDNLDEAMVMSQSRQGITAFRALPVPQGSGLLHVTEIDPTHHADHFSKFHF